MLVVTIHLWPGGDKTKARHLGTAYIANDMTGTGTLGNYRVMLSKWGDPSAVWKTARVTGFNRLKGSPWELLRRALASTVNGKAGTDPALRREMRTMARAANAGQTTLLEQEENDDIWTECAASDAHS